MQRPSRQVRSNQPSVHPHLAERVARHRRHRFMRPCAAHSRDAFASCLPRVAAGAPLILDAGCGTGASSVGLAQRHPDALVIGVDKSPARLARGPAGRVGLPENVILLRADLVDFWRLAAAAGWTLWRHCIFYPNPWPKPGHLGRRWHAHPVFPELLALGGTLELRTNWAPYAEEWLAALALHGRDACLEELAGGDAPVSPFERKYLASGHRCWRVRAAGADE